MEYTQREMPKLELAKTKTIEYCSIIWLKQLAKTFNEMAKSFRHNDP